MTIESGPRPSLSYLMPPGSEPEYFEVYIPQITTDAGEKAFKSDILTVIGLSICRRDGLCRNPRLELTTTKDMVPRLVMSATIMCDTVNCPLRGGGGTNDREPREPLPVYPADSVQLDESQPIVL